MTRVISLLSLTTLLLATGCGRTLKELNSGEQERLRSVLATIGKSTSAISSVNTQTATTSGTQMSSLSPLFKQLVDEKEAKKESEEMSRRLKQAISNGQCSVMNSLPKQNQFAGVKEAKFSITGRRCPIEAEVTVTGSGSEKGGNVEFTIKYSSHDLSFSELGGIDSADLKGSLTFNNAASFGQDMNVEVTLDLSGTAHSLAEGDFHPYLKNKTSMFGNVQDKSMRGSTEFVFGVDLKDFSGEVRMTAEFEGQKATSKYYLNNKEMSEADFQKWMTGLQVPGPTPALGM